jgi:hypothetical protein
VEKEEAGMLSVAEIFVNPRRREEQKIFYGAESLTAVVHPSIVACSVPLRPGTANNFA